MLTSLIGLTILATTPVQAGNNPKETPETKPGMICAAGPQGPKPKKDVEIQPYCDPTPSPEPKPKPKPKKVPRTKPEK